MATGTSGTDSAEIVGWWRRPPSDAGSADLTGWRSIGPGMNALSRWCAVGAKGRIARYHANQWGP